MKFGLSTSYACEIRPDFRFLHICPHCGEHIGHKIDSKEPSPIGAHHDPDQCAKARLAATKKGGAK